MRADVYLFNKGYVKSRQKAKCLIEAKNVKINGQIISKPSFEIAMDEEICIEIFDDCPFVSRGALKLKAMLDILRIDLTNKLAIDIGASTGGFTHCLITNGVSRVYAIDTGTNQLDPIFKNDNRVISIEGTNARDLNEHIVPEKVDIITVDVSFISQTLIIPTALNFLNKDGVYIGLIKPQFEVGKSKIGKGGIVKEAKYRKEAVEKIVKCMNENDFFCIALIESPIQGGDGNVEYVAAFSKDESKIISKHQINNCLK
ncbi:MAG: TlyA family RNA methyltransferase [Clostridia bacterium]|nr:TlyA family RNA methyltransferase [Clostridia bacterium]